MTIHFIRHTENIYHHSQQPIFLTQTSLLPIYTLPMEVDQASRVVLPGDVIHEATNSEQQGVITLGPGLRQDGEHIVATKAGMLKHAPPMRWWIESNQKRVCYSRTQGGDFCIYLYVCICI